MPVLAAEGGDTRNLARLASRLARANAAVEILVDGAERYLALRDREALAGRDSRAPASIRLQRQFAALPEEIRLRLLLRAINRFGHEGPAELGKVEALLAALDRALAENAGAAGQDGQAADKAETDPGRRTGQPDRRPDPRRAGAAPPPADRIEDGIARITSQSSIRAP